MAIVKEIKKSIKAQKYVNDSIAYILLPKDKSGEEKCFKFTCINCEGNEVDTLSKQFRFVRKAFDKDNNILAHHYVQSFSPNEKITPELAHQIGIELSKNVATGFQVIVSTHIDKDHIHNHIIINSVSMETGMKWRGNGDTLKVLRKESDKICKTYGLSVIENQSGLQGIDQSTQKLAEQGKSWKIDLCKALDEAIKICNSKDDFISFMKNKKFLITRYTDLNITFQKIGEKRKIRTDTLARQFGDYYTKENLEKLMGFYSLPKKKNQEFHKNKTTNRQSFITEFEKYEKDYFRKNLPPAKIDETKVFQKIIKNSNNAFFILLLILLKLLIRKHPKKLIDKKYFTLHKYCKQKSYKIQKLNIYKALQKYEKICVIAGNIPYKSFISAQGENYRVKLALSAVPKLYAYPFFFSARLYSNYAIVTIKAKDKQLLQKALEVENIQLLEQHNKHFTALSKYNNLKQIARQLDVKLEFLIIDKNQLTKLSGEKDRFVALQTKDGKIRLAFLPQNKQYIFNLLYPEKKQISSNISSVVQNSKIITQLKPEALLGGQKMRYRILTKSQDKEPYSKPNNKELFVEYNECDKERIDSISKRINLGRMKK